MSDLGSNFAAAGAVGAGSGGAAAGSAQERKNRPGRPASEPAPASPGWYPDPATGGTRYSDGSRWTGAARPRRRPFAADANYGILPHALVGWGAFIVVALVVATAAEAGFFAPVAIGIPIILILITVSVYYARGRGPTTDTVKADLKKVQEDQEAAAEKAAKLARRRKPFFHFGNTVEASDVVGAAQVQAIANPQTARALQNLQNLLYTQAITDAEYEAAKNKLLGPAAFFSPSSDPIEQVAQLAELHRGGILSDVEFAAAKAKVFRL